MISAAGLFSGLLAIPNSELQQKALKSLLFLLYHSFPKVRKITSEKLYTVLITIEDTTTLMGEGKEDSLELATEVISNTDWSENLKIISPGKENLYAIFGLTVAGAKKETKVGEEETKEGEG